MSFFSFGDSPNKANESSFFTQGDDFADHKDDGQRNSFFNTDWSSKPEDPLPAPSPAAKKRKAPDSISKNVRKSPETLTLTTVPKAMDNVEEMSDPGTALTPSKAGLKDAATFIKDERNVKPIIAKEQEDIDLNPEKAMMITESTPNMEDLYNGALTTLKQMLADKSQTVRKYSEEDDRLLGRSSLLVSDIKSYRADMADRKHQYTSRLSQVSSFLMALEQKNLQEPKNRN